jgi:hypothetical protein
MVQTIPKGAVLRVDHAYHRSERDGSQDQQVVHVSSNFKEDSGGRRRLL